MQKEPKRREGIAQELERLRRRVAELEESERELERTRRALELGAQAYLKVLESAPEVVVLLDSDTTIMSVSPSIEAITGHRVEDVVGKRALDFVHPGDLQRLSEVLYASLDAPGKAFREELRFRAADGSFMYADFTGLNFLDNPVVGAVIITARDVTERKAMQATIAEREAYYRSIIENIHDVILIIDAEGTMAYISPSLERVFGYLPERLINRSPKEFLALCHPDDVDAYIAFSASCAHQPGLSGPFEFRAFHADGTERVVESRSINLLDNPAVRGMVRILRDVTGRKAAEAAVAERERYYRSIIENIHDVILIIDAEGTMAYISPSLERVFGYLPERLINRPPTDLLQLCHPDDVQGLLDFVAASTGVGAVPEPFEFRAFHADGTERVVESTSINLLDDASVRGVVYILRDVTDRKAVEAALKDRESYYRSLIRNAADMVTLLDTDLTICWGSRSSGAVTGYSPQEIYGQPIAEYIHPDERADSRADFEFVLENPGVPLKVERRFRHRDGTYHWHQAILTNLLHDPSVRGIIINSRDITERVLMEEQLRERNRELNDFASTVSHDLRTPIALIEGYAQLMRPQDTMEEEREVYLRNIIDAARRMDELIESLLDYAQAGQRREEPEPCDPAEVLKGVLDQYHYILDWNNIEVSVQGGLPRVLAERARLHQVFANLVDNAIKYMGENDASRIDIGAERAMDTVTFFVRDNGQGVDPAFRDEIFAPFKRASSSSKGLGIGLATVKRAVEGWGGRIWVESQPGEGATFYFTAPAA